MTSFTFKTKAQNLVQLRPIINKSNILQAVYFTVSQWEQNHSYWIEHVIAKFEVSLLAIRSSSLCEDSFESSLAGQFESILNVEPRPSDIKLAINAVVASYKEFTTDYQDFEILVQPMLPDVKCSGVLFTRTLETFAPYYVINYDDVSSLTDSVTSGAYNTQKHVLVYKHASPKNQWWSNLIEAVRELESVCNCDSLDIEFALNSNDEVFIFQVRPLVSNVIRHHGLMDQKTKKQISEIQAFAEYRRQRKPGMFGEHTILGQMPDWNPAEIIGTRPKPLAYSLYNHVIMDSAWRKGRSVLGYQTPESYGLMVQIAGRPYVDVRSSFNSLLPMGLSPELSEKLVNYYIQRLFEHPHYHDKVEFFIVHSCLDFKFSEVEALLKQHGFFNEEIHALRSCLLQLTQNLIDDSDKLINGLLEQVDYLQTRRRAWETADALPTTLLTAIDVLLKDSMVYGTVPFASIARCAFIGTQILRSLVSTGVLSEDELHQFLISIETVASEYTMDMHSYSKGELSLEEMCRRYGHLRPGTYDITAPRYDERPEIYFSASATEIRKEQQSRSFQFRAEQLSAIQSLLSSEGFNVSVHKLLDFISRSIMLREKIKFEFTKNISLALKYIGEFGKYHGFTVDEMAFLPIEHLLRWEQEPLSDSFVDQCRYLIDEQKFIYTGHAQLVVPDLIMNTEDLEVIRMIQSNPNFSSSRRIVAESVLLQHSVASNDLDLKGKIVMIENADPGYDWLFSRQIAGLITKYGGVASHMAVRCSEFGIPAAIGCGEWLFKELQRSVYIDLNCQEKRVRPCEAAL
ncbi:PEP/pyruvate-binding domain-containing protein [Cohnella panacarvi]|uniref:PEP/pyruvate-binding domain-containing protein n=1 Tax=Cohnella panacarvi TaxID=400776 RepID=UPI0004789BFC|nr:PEP/pyruvate-binding domain-containing protein [Cohnella panacarvi]